MLEENERETSEVGMPQKLDTDFTFLQHCELIARKTLRGNVYVLYKYLNFIGVQLIYNVVLVSDVQQSDSVIHIHIFIVFQILFPYRSLQSIE